MTLDDLITALREATGPDEALDYEIEMLCQPVCQSWKYPPPFTASLDAALTLVPEGWRVYNLSQDPDQGMRWFAGLDAIPIRCGHWIAYTNKRAPTPALALCVAALEARRGRV